MQLRNISKYCLANVGIAIRDKATLSCGQGYCKCIHQDGLGMTLGGLNNAKPGDVLCV